MVILQDEEAAKLRTAKGQPRNKRARKGTLANVFSYDGPSSIDWMDDCKYHVCVVVFRPGGEHAHRLLRELIMTGSRAVSKTTRQSGLAHWQVELALRLLLNDSGSGHSLKQIAAHCGLSRSYFEKAFKASLGTPPHRWLVRQRIQQAGEKLEQTNDSVSSIALSCGFTDQSHLTRVFGAIVGSSPAAWRRQRKASVAPLQAAIR